MANYKYSIRFAGQEDTSGAVQEDGALKATGKLTAVDSDSHATLLWSVVNSGAGTYGTLAIDATGKWTYNLNNSAANVQSLAAGEKASDVFTVKVTDNHGVTATQTVKVKVIGTDDAPVIAGTNTGSVKEDAIARATGQLSLVDIDRRSDDDDDQDGHGGNWDHRDGDRGIHDVDGHHGGDDHKGNAWSVVGGGAGTYGALSVDRTGKWTYVLNNGASNVQSLPEGESRTESFTVQARTGDGHDPIVTRQVLVTVTGTNDVATITGNRTGTVTEDGGITFQAEAFYAAGPRPVIAAAADLNGDGKLDLVVPDLGNGSISLLLGNGDGTFQPGSSYLAADGGDPQQVTVKDLNGDGKLDLVAAIPASNAVAVLLGNGDGTFLTSSTYQTGASPRRSIATDLNADGKPDLAITDKDADTVSILLGNGDGTFQAESSYAAGPTPDSLAVGDLNGDSRPDLVVTNIAANSFSVLLGNGDGTFQTPSIFATGGASYPYALALEDLNGDGRRDVAIVNSTSNNISVLLGNGDGTFQAPSLYDAGPEPLSISVGDLDGDGKLDLVVASDVGTFSVLVGNGDGTFQVPTTDSLAGVGSGDGVVADFNGDGRGDLVFSNQGSDSVSVLLNSSSATPGTRIATGHLTVADVDAGQSSVVAQATLGAHGSFAIVAAGDWTYTLDNSDAAVQALGAGQSLNETFTVVSIDHSASQTVAITINGANDAPAFSVSDAGVQQLVQAMAAFGPSGAGQTMLSPDVADGFAPTLAANWQPS